MGDSHEEHAYLWDGSEPGWVLWDLPEQPVPVIYNRITRLALIIEDDDEAADVIRTMRAQGVEVITKPPSG